MIKFGRSAWIGLGVGASAGVGLVLFLIYKEMKRRICQRLSLQNNPDSFNTESTSITDSQVPKGQAGLLLRARAQGAVHGLSPEQQVELRNCLDDVLQCVTHLRGEVASLRNGLQDIAARIVQDVRSSVEESQKVARRRRHLPPRERTDSMSSSSIYFTASAGSTCLYDGESEGGYTTANAESDYYGEAEMDRGTDEEDQTFSMSRTLRQESSDAGDDEAEEFSDAEPPGHILAPLLSQHENGPSSSPQEKTGEVPVLHTNQDQGIDGTSLKEAQKALKD